MIGPKDAEGKLSWRAIADAIEMGHNLPRAEISDQFLHRGDDTLLSRAAWVDGLGIGVKSCSVLPGNAHSNIPTIHGAMVVFEDKTGLVEAVIDSDLITKWKTAADSVLGARLLARKDSRTLMIIGAGAVSESLVEAYSEVFPNLKNIQIWNRSAARAESLAEKMTAQGYPVTATTDLPAACAGADIIATATMSSKPVLMGEWVTPGTHVDMIGAFKADMREGDDALLQKSRIFVDSFETTMDHIGELKIPLQNGAITKDDVLADFYDLVAGKAGRESEDDITLFKNGGGAHLDMMTAKAILKAI